MKTSGWILAAAGIGMMCGLVSEDILAIPSGSPILTTAFIGHLLQHISVVVSSFIGGNLIPNMFANKDK